MGELNAELVAAIERSSAELNQELSRLRRGAIRLEEHGEHFKQASEAIAGAGDALSSTAEQLKALGQEVAKLDPASVTRAIDEANRGIASVTDVLQRVQELVDQKSRTTQEALADIVKRIEAVAGAVSGGAAQVKDVAGALERRLLASESSMESRLLSIANGVEGIGTTSKKAFGDLGEVVRERTAALGVVRGMLVGVISLLLLAIATLWFRR